MFNLFQVKIVILLLEPQLYFFSPFFSIYLLLIIFTECNTEKKELFFAASLKPCGQHFGVSIT